MTEAATEAIRVWRADPVKFVRDVFADPVFMLPWPCLASGVSDAP